MNLKSGLFRTAVVAAIFVFSVGVVHRLLTEVLAGLIGDPAWLHGLTSLFVAGGLVLATVALLSSIFPGSLDGVVRWIGRGFKR